MSLQEKLISTSKFMIVGAGAAGTAAAKCFAAAGLAQQVVLFEQHSEPGGSAGYFSRGQPRRTFDAGATQLIECGRGQLQHDIYSLSPAQGQRPAEDIFERIPAVIQHWHMDEKKIVIHADGRVEWRGTQPPDDQQTAELQKLENFLAVCQHEADWMWRLLSHIPRFPLQSFSDICRAAAIFFKVPLSKKFMFPVLFLLNCNQMMRIYGIRRGSLAHDVISGLLVDTTQNSAEKSPWLAAAMGISIVGRGIFRCKNGMRSYFRPLMSSFEEKGGEYKPHQKLVRLESSATGFKLTFRDGRSGEQSTYETQESVLLNLTLWDIVNDLIPEADVLRENRVYRKWQKIAATEKGWGAFAVHALIKDQPDWPDHPFYHQIFPAAHEPEFLQSSLYVSLPARYDPANPQGFRVLTATLHIRTESSTEENRSVCRDFLAARIERNLGSPLSQIETATPRTFERYIGRLEGQVGGVPLRVRNFLFLSSPSVLAHPIKPECKLILMGDTVFPGQGVVACSVSGIAAFERATGIDFEKIRAGAQG
jgi:phytoene dehydrogenase-like protein